MKYNRLIFLLLFFFVPLDFYSQEVTISNVEKKQSLSKIFDAFNDQYQFSFSYDVNAIKDILLKIETENVSISFLQKIIEKQTSYLLQKISDNDYILINNTTMVDICGVVIDAASSYELIKADILKNTSLIDITDNEGIFKLQLHPWDSISISYLGYEARTIKVSEFSTTHCDTIKLNPDIQNLSQVVVKEYLTKGIQKNQDGSVNVSNKTLKILPGLVEPDVLQSLQLLPGISSPTEDPAGLYIRGGTPSQNLILWDGIKMYQSGHFFNQISTFNPFITKNVKVYRGGTSVRYGDRISGVIVIESDDDLTEKIKAGGGLNLTHGDLFVKIPLSKKLGVLIAGRRSTTDIYQNITYDNLVRKVFQNTRANIPDIDEEQTSEGQSRDDDFSYSDSYFKILWNPNNKNTLKLSSIFTENRLNNNNVVQSQVNNDRSLVQDILKLRNIGFSVNWDKNYTANIRQNINFYFSSYDQRYNYVADRLNTGFKAEIAIDNIVKDIGGEYSLHLPIAKQQSLDIGYQFTYNETIYSIFSRDSGSFNSIEFMDEINGNGVNNTVYSEYKYKTPKTYVNIGLRGSQISNADAFFIEPRMFSSMEILKKLRITASAELKNQQLNNYLNSNTADQDIPSLPVSDNVWILSNNSSSNANIDPLPFIRVLKSMQYTLGGLYSYKGWNFDLEGYYKKLRDISSLSGNDVLDIVSPDDIDIIYGQEERIGLDFLLKKRIQNYRFWLGYSLSKTLTSFPLIQDSYYNGDFDQRHVLNFSQTLNVDNFEFALGWNYATGRPFTKILEDEDGTTIAPQGINSSRFKDYHRLDASVVYRFGLKTKQKWDGMIGISLRNLYNRKNIISQSFRDVETENSNFITQSVQNESLRITPDVVVRFKF
ncbi:TonB-dependent receptor plug domain-containing protein [Aquimarina sp. RZ0]|uniref:TonB-dependent receptor n=1 Tax=Aquimarina sp. RZ0 TaxID=2607730 RepID=UPI0011F28F24|nr:TonB-dependent receptor plug domain-containing protein [Aquimarina sp. RZ0]KAA1246849.1 TonB-dependent receptor plug domain-containing protein [Aquimarina sp. RZ0]